MVSDEAIGRVIGLYEQEIPLEEIAIRMGWRGKSVHIITGILRWKGYPLVYATEIRCQQELRRMTKSQIEGLVQ